MTDTTLTIILASIPATIGAITAAIVALKSLRQTKVNTVKADEQIVKADEQIAKTAAVESKTEEIVKKTEEIHTLTNGTASQLRLELQVQSKEISGLKDLVAVLTASQQPRDIPGPPGPAGEVGPAGPKGDSAKK